MGSGKFVTCTKITNCCPWWLFDGLPGLEKERESQMRKVKSEKVKSCQIQERGQVLVVKAVSSWASFSWAWFSKPKKASLQSQAQQSSIKTKKLSFHARDTLMNHQAVSSSPLTTFLTMDSCCHHCDTLSYVVTLLAFSGVSLGMLSPKNTNVGLSACLPRCRPRATVAAGLPLHLDRWG